MHLHPAATATGGLGTISTVEAGGGGAFGHQRARLRRGKKSIPGTNPQAAGRVGGVASGNGAAIAGRRILRVDPRHAVSRGQLCNNDLWIAAHASAADLILVTNNEREFRRIQGLEIQNWAD